MRNITLFSTGPSCVKCRFTLSMMKKAGIVPDYVDLSTGAELPADVAALPASMAPIVVVRDEAGVIVMWWADARPDKIKELAAELQTQQAA